MARDPSIPVDEPPAYMDEVPPYGEDIHPSEEKPVDFRATAFQWRPTADIPKREWLYGKHLLRKFVSVDVAAGGVGKSSVKIVEALSMTTGRMLYAKELHEGPLNVWLYNLEDPLDETERRIHAAVKWFRIDPEEFVGRLYVDSGRDQRCVIAHETFDGARIINPITEAIISEIKRRAIDVLIIDPFVSSHELSENDNRAMDLVAKEWGRIADVCNCSINLIHHIRKTNGEAATIDSARGAKALTDAARSVVVYNRMTKDEAETAGIPADQVGFYFRAGSEKANLAPMEKAEWYRMNNVDLENGDKVGVASPWDWPDLFAGVTVSKTKEVQRLVDAGDFRVDPRSPAWVGTIIATVLAMDPEEDAKRIAKILRQWIQNKVLRVEEAMDEQRKMRKFVRVGEWITE